MTGSKNISGLILAGGAGLRVQGRDKGLLPWRGKPLIEHVAGRLKPQVGHLFINCNRNGDHYAKYGDSLIRDSRSDYQGPLAGIEAVIPLLARSDYLVVVACDTPLLPVDLVARLIEPLENEHDQAPVISYANDGERDQYLFAALHVSCLESLPPYLESGQRTVRHWFQTQHAVAVDFSDQTGAFVNYNRLD
jgi:molybdopterin-guanine dinucleotide biosynthesis protein A